MSRSVARRLTFSVAALVSASSLAAPTSAAVKPPLVPPSFACLAKYESGNSNTPLHNGRYGQWGYFQIFTPTFHWVTGLSGNASQYSLAVQLRAAQAIQRAQGWKAWPFTSRLCGLR